MAATIIERFPTQSGREVKSLPAYPHQREALDFVARHPRAYLELKMGAGKSRIVVEALDNADARCALILCPKAVVSGVWPGQFRDWSPRPWRVVPSTEIKGTSTKKAEVIAKAIETSRLRGEPVAVVVNYEGARTDAMLRILCRQRYDLAVLDEAHKIKSPRGRTSKDVARICRQANRVIGMSGTPMPHSPLDIFAQFRAIDPLVLGRNWWEFRSRYAIMGGYRGKNIVGVRDMEGLTARLAPSMYSPPADAVDLNLPEAVHRTVRVDLEPKARKLYDALRDGLVAEIDAGEINAANGLVKLLRMQQLGSGLAVVDAGERAAEGDEAVAAMLAGEDIGGDSLREEHVVSTAKREALTDLLDATHGDPFVVFGQFRHDIRVAREAAAACDRTIGEISGKANDLAAFQAGKLDVLVVQITSGAEGIDLTRARFCAYLSTGFNGGAYQQSLARVHRPGQTRRVTYYHIRARDTVDDMVAAVLSKRRSVVEDVLAMIRPAE